MCLFAGREWGSSAWPPCVPQLCQGGGGKKTSWGVDSDAGWRNSPTHRISKTTPRTPSQATRVTVKTLRALGTNVTPRRKVVPFHPDTSCFKPLIQVSSPHTHPQPPEWAPGRGPGVQALRARAGGFVDAPHCVSSPRGGGTRRPQTGSRWREEDARAAACTGDLPRAAWGASRAPARASRRARAGGARLGGRSAIVAGLACSCFGGPAASAAASHAGAEPGDVLLP